MDLTLAFSPDGADLVIDGDITTATGMAEAIYISLFGGNSGARPWWGNLIAETDDHKVESRTLTLLEALPATPRNLSLIQDAVAADLQWIVGDRGFADEFTVDVTMPGLNLVLIKIACTVKGETFGLSFRKGWGK